MNQIEKQILEEEYQVMLDHLTFRSESPSFKIEEIEQEYHHLLIYQGQDWDGRGQVKNAEIQGHVHAYEVFLKRWRDKHN
ncbi:MAG: hypothetical protein GX842_00415 [Spirochaetales bacterium]|nr:hypothetical protein [Spirochaetales bacterium]